jgi:hypothetical protein
MQAVTEHACECTERRLCLDHINPAALIARCWRSEGNLTD